MNFTFRQQHTHKSIKSYSNNIKKKNWLKKSQCFVFLDILTTLKNYMVKILYIIILYLIKEHNIIIYLYKIIDIWCL